MVGFDDGELLETQTGHRTCAQTGYGRPSSAVWIITHNIQALKIQGLKPGISKVVWLRIPAPRSADQPAAAVTPTRRAV